MGRPLYDHVLESLRNAYLAGGGTARRTTDIERE
jgi:hypothetical protein